MRVKVEVAQLGKMAESYTFSKGATIKDVKKKVGYKKDGFQVLVRGKEVDDDYVMKHNDKIIFTPMVKGGRDKDPFEKTTGKR